jgi:hypothetical protein
MGCGADNIQSGIAFKGGLFMPSDENIDSVWGTGFVYGIDYRYMFEGQKYGLDLTIEYFQKSTDILYLFYTAKYTLIPITASFVYFPIEGVNIYLGGGAGLYLAKISWIYSASNSGFGLHLKGGLAFGNGFFIEGKYSFLAKAGDLDVTGANFLVGYRIKI